MGPTAVVDVMRIQGSGAGRRRVRAAQCATPGPAAEYPAALLAWSVQVNSSNPFAELLMRRPALVLSALLLAASTLSATETKPAKEAVPEARLAVEEEKAPPVAPELKLAKVDVKETAPATESAPAQLGERGSFWWIVGVIVVAGVILAVVL
jgi:hypothetical protein